MEEIKCSLCKRVYTGDHCTYCFTTVDVPNWKDPKTWPLEEQVKYVQSEALKLWQDRQTKYGPSNIAITGALGCYVRSQDKLARLGRVYKEGAKGTPDESIEDSWLDLMNYAMMGLMCHRGWWPGA